MFCYLLSMAALVLFILFANNPMGILGLERFTSLDIDQANAPYEYAPRSGNKGDRVASG